MLLWGNVENFFFLTMAKLKQTSAFECLNPILNTVNLPARAEIYRQRWVCMIMGLNLYCIFLENLNTGVKLVCNNKNQ